VKKQLKRKEDQCKHREVMRYDGEMSPGHRESRHEWTRTGALESIPRREPLSTWWRTGKEQQSPRGIIINDLSTCARTEHPPLAPRNPALLLDDVRVPAVARFLG
jgi:hypothetical protein